MRKLKTNQNVNNSIYSFKIHIKLLFFFASVKLNVLNFSRPVLSILLCIEYLIVYWKIPRVSNFDTFEFLPFVFRICFERTNTLQNKCEIQEKYYVEAPGMALE